MSSHFGSDAMVGRRHYPFYRWGSRLAAWSLKSSPRLQGVGEWEGGSDGTVAHPALKTRRGGPFPVQGLVAYMNY